MQRAMNRPAKRHQWPPYRLTDGVHAPTSAPAQIWIRILRISLLLSPTSRLSTTSAPFSLPCSWTSDSTRPSRTEMMIAASMVSRRVCERRKVRKGRGGLAGEKDAQ